jgi:hypothetical protein
MSAAQPGAVAQRSFARKHYSPADRNWNRSDLARHQRRPASAGNVCPVNGFTFRQSLPESDSALPAVAVPIQKKEKKANRKRHGGAQKYPRTG